MLNYRKSRFWVIVVSIFIVTAVGIGLIANSKVKEADEDVVYTTNTDGSAKIVEDSIFAIDPTETSEPKGEIKKYVYQNLEIELTNVKSDRTETMLDHGEHDWKYTVITCYPGAELTVINAGMSDPAYSADGKAHPNWGILKFSANAEERIKITDDLQPIEITSSFEGVYNLEASLYVFKFEEYTE